MEQKYAAWAEQLWTAGSSTVLAWAELVLSCPSAPQAPWWAQLSVKHHGHGYQPCRAHRQGAMHALAMCPEKWDFFLPVFPILSLCYPIDPSQALHLVLRARISHLCLQTDAQEFWALLSLALAAWLNGTGHHPVSLATSVPSACLGLAPCSSYAPSH